MVLTPVSKTVPGIKYVLKCSMNEQTDLLGTRHFAVLQAGMDQAVPCPQIYMSKYYLPPAPLKETLFENTVAVEVISSDEVIQKQRGPHIR